MSHATELRLDSLSRSFDRGAKRRPRPSTLAAIRTVLLAIGLILAFAASPAAARSLSSLANSKSAALGGPGTVYSTIEEAALGALRFASTEKQHRYRGRIRAGKVVRAGDGFSYQEPTQSRDTIWSLAPPVVRFEFTGEDVASYVVYPRSGRASLDRANEELRSSLRRRIEDSDYSTRPLFLLTPKQRVIRYAPGEKAEILSLREDRGVAAVLP